MGKIKGWEKISKDTYQSIKDTQIKRVFVSNGWEVLYKNQKGYVIRLGEAISEIDAKSKQLNYMRSHPNG